MPQRLEINDVTAFAQTSADTPGVVNLGWPGGIVRRITVVIPDGHAGLTGIALGYGGAPVVPYTQPAYISGNDEIYHLEWLDRVPGVPWQAFVCNNDIQTHTFEVRFELDELGTVRRRANRQTVPSAAIEAAAVQQTAAA